VSTLNPSVQTVQTVAKPLLAQAYAILAERRR
jgi:hypothetical protein